MDDLGIARACPGADSVLGFQDQRIDAALRHLSRARQANNAGAGDNAVDMVHG